MSIPRSKIALFIRADVLSRRRRRATRAVVSRNNLLRSCYCRNKIRARRSLRETSDKAIVWPPPQPIARTSNYPDITAYFASRFTVSRVQFLSATCKNLLKYELCRCLFTQCVCMCMRKREGERKDSSIRRDSPCSTARCLTF